jgi:hypothetical protein
MPISFGDRVRVRPHVESQAIGMAGHIGEVRGITTPSVTGVHVVGGSDDDCAYNVFVETVNRDAWFGAALLEFVDHDPGTTITLDGVPKVWTRTSAGEWTEAPRQLAPREWWSWFRGTVRRWSRR